MEVTRPRGQATSVLVPLIKVDDTDYADTADYAYAAGDIIISKDGGTPANISTAPTEVDFSGRSVMLLQIDLTAAEMQADFIDIVIVDAATSVLEMQTVKINTMNFGGTIWCSEITSVTDNGQFIIDEGPAVADVFNGCVIMVVDQTTKTQRSVGIIADYIVTTREIHLVNDLADPATIAANDLVFIYPPTLLPTTLGRTLTLDANGRIDVSLIEGTDATDQIRDSVLDDATRFSGGDIASILTDTGTTLPGVLGTPAGADLAADIASVQADTDAIETDTQDIQSRLPAALVSGRMDSDVQAIAGSTTAATNLKQGALALVPTAVNDASATTTSCVTDLTEATDDHYNGRIMTFTSGNLAGQSTDITDYDGTTKTLTYTALTEAPADNDEFTIS